VTSPAVASAAPQTFTPLETWLATAAGMTAFFTALFTASMVNVAVPSVIGSFGVGQTQAQLLLSGFFAMNSTGLLASSWMVARFGQREVFLGSLLVFGSAGLLCFTAPSFEFLVLGRLIQGLAAGFLQPLIMLVLVQVFPPEKRGLAMGMFTMGVTAAVGIGPAVGGVIIEAFQWRLIFLAPIPFTLLAAVLAYFFVPASPSHARPPRFDWLGFALVNAIVFCWFTLLGNGQRWGWSSDIALSFAVGVVVAVVLFFWSQRRPGVTLVDLSLFQNRSYAAGFGIIFFFGFGTLAMVYAFPIFGQLVQNFPPITAGTLLLPASLIAAAMMPFTGRATDIVPHKTLLFIGLVISSVSVFGLIDADSNTHYWYIVLMLLLTRIGSAIVTPPMMTAPLLGLPASQMQRGAGLANFAVIFGGANGAALYAVFLEQRIQHHATTLGATQTFANDTARELLQSAGMLISQAGVSDLVRDGIALSHLGQMIVAQATALGFQDGFIFIGLSMVVPFLPLIFMSPKLETKP
jgi:MFS transporter, DHA2 family, multidrug resistance protein